MKKVLVISVHADDEVLGCGATLIKHNQSGDSIYWLIVTTPEGKYPQAFCEKRKEQIAAVKSMLKIEEVFYSNVITTTLDESKLGSLIASLSDVLREVQPNIIYMPNRTDIHTDHQVVAKAVISATKSFRAPSSLEKILMMEVISETEQMPAFPETMFMPNVYSVFKQDILKKKESIWDIYAETEGQIYPQPRCWGSIEALARYRGATVSAEYAEAFMLVKEIV